MKVVDIGDEMAELFKQEELLAFFDVRLAVPGRAPIEGLGRLSKPKKNAAGRSYLSLFFLIDTPDASTRADVDGYFRGVRWETWTEIFDGVRDVIPMPAMRPSPDMYIAAVDITTKDGFVTDEAGGRRILGSLAELLPGELGDVTSWNAGATEGPVPSLWERFKKRLLG